MKTAVAFYTRIKCRKREEKKVKKIKVKSRKKEGKKPFQNIKFDYQFLMDKFDKFLVSRVF